MDDDIKVYKPQTIQDTPFPTQDPVVIPGGQGSGGGVLNAEKIRDKPMPRKFIAHETIGSALNTKSRRILGEFQFTESGAISVGKYVEGVSGDIRITPAGIVSRDSSGNVTFALDGETGNAVFKGEIQSGSLVTGSIIMDQDGEIVIGDNTGATIIDSQGIVSANNFRIYSDTGSPFFAFDGTTYLDVTGASLTITLTRQVQAFVSIAIVAASAQTNDTLDAEGRNWFRLQSDLDGEMIDMFYDSFIFAEGLVRENFVSKTYSTSGAISMSPGTHTITLQGKITDDINLQSNVNEFDIVVLILGS